MMPIGIRGFSQSYFSRLLTDLSKHGHVTGNLALTAGKRRLVGGKSVDIPPNALVPVAALPVNPCKHNEVGPGVSAFFNVSAPVVQLPLIYPSHMSLQTVHLKQDGTLYLQGKLGGEHLRFANHTHTIGNLTPHLNHIGELLTGVCSKAAGHPIMGVDKVVALERSTLQLQAGCGAEIKFDAQGRLPYSGLRALQTRVYLGAPTVEGSAPGAELRVVLDCELLSADGSAPRKMRIDLNACLQGVKRAATDDEIEAMATDAAAQQAESTQDAESTVGSESAQEDDETPREAIAPFCAAMYDQLMSSLPLSGELALLEQRWSKLSSVLPDAAAAVGECRIFCETDNAMRFTHIDDRVEAKIDRKLMFTVPAQHIHVKFGWLKRLLSHLLVVAVSKVQLYVNDRDDDGRINTRVEGTAGLKIGRFTFGHFKVARDLRLKPPDGRDLFEQMDNAAFNIAKEYTYSPLVNTTHLVRLSQSDIDIDTQRFETVLLSGRVMHAQHTRLYLGKHPEGALGSVDHDADIVGNEGCRGLHLGAAVTLQNWPEPTEMIVPDEFEDSQDRSEMHVGLGDQGLRLDWRASERVSRALVGGLGHVAGGALGLAKRIPRPH